MRHPLVLCSLLAISAAAWSKVTVLSTTKQSYKPTASDSNLLAYRFERKAKQIRFPGEPVELACYMTDVRTVLKTKSIDDIEKYGVVQYIRGCQWSSQWDGKTVTKSMNIVRDHFGSNVVFRHRGWEIDSDSTDPIYSSYKDERFALWRWNTDPTSLDADTATLLHDGPTPHPTVFVTDAPGAQALNLDRKSASNSTLEFRTCLFNITDLPLATDKAGSNIDQSKALHCFEWNSNYVFDFKEMKMKSPATIDPICEVDSTP